ncbi:5989_t:CDS:1, partial [Cetraspora pellucida]
MQNEASPDAPSPTSSGGVSTNEQSSEEINIAMKTELPEIVIQPSDALNYVSNGNAIDSVLMKLEHAAYISSWIDHPQRGVLSRIIRR